MTVKSDDDGPQAGSGKAGFRPRTLLAHAKVNLYLAVGGRRPDGFHDVTTVLQALELSDEVSVSPEGRGTTLERDVDLGIPPEEDLGFRAAEAWRTISGYGDGIRIRVRKHIPAGAGLGGGSADAAAVLAALSGRTSPNEPVEPALARVAASLGSDVPFFLGRGTQLMKGRGDVPVRPLPTPALPIALVNPGVPVPTGAAYARFDRQLGPPVPSPRDLLDAIRFGDIEAIAVRLFNNMTEASCALVPETAAALRFLEEREGVLGAAMAGSGSTVFGVFGSPVLAERAAAEARERGMWAVATGTAAAGVEEAAG